MNPSTTTTPPELEVSTTGRELAADAMKLVERQGHTGPAAVGAARKAAWQARMAAVLAGDATLADAWIDALAHLGDKGGIVALAERAKAAVKGDRA